MRKLRRPRKDRVCKKFRGVITLSIALIILPILCAITVAQVFEKFGELPTTIVALLVTAGYLWLLDEMSED